MARRGRDAVRARTRTWSVAKTAVLCALLAGAAGISAWEGTLSRFSAQSLSSVGAVIGAVLVAALACGRGRQRKTSAAWARDGLAAVRRAASGRAEGEGGVAAATVVWVLLVAATIGWDLNSFAHEVRWLPTLSRLFGDVTDHDWGRAVVFAAWLALGLYLAIGWWLPRSERPGALRAVEPATGDDEARTPGRPGARGGANVVGE
jgi:hypothetical protein